MAFAEQLGGTPPVVKRIAVTEQQITQYGLQAAPQKRSNRRGDHMPRPFRPRPSAPPS
ncbi:hypothetical protein ACFQ7J_21930 [Streptomyces sp. NPDC056501]|uniref:hypothetical protein n=1 Tax=Streptomyces sp. NPDC056501 TaxID=3345841 RepID=UPI00368A7298